MYYFVVYSFFIFIVFLGGLPLELLGVAARQGHLLAPVVRAVALADLRVVLLVGLALREQVRDHLDVAAAHLEGAHAAGGVAAHDPGDAGALRDQAAAGVDLVVDREGGVGHRGGRVGGANGSLRSAQVRAYDDRA